jgi:hypothetical protein
MPQVLRMNGYSVFIYVHDHYPPHVHVRRGGGWCTIAIGGDGEPPSLLDLGSLRRTEAGQALWLVNASQEMLLAHWRRIHGTGCPDR